MSEPIDHELLRQCHLSGQMSSAQSVYHFGAPKAAEPEPEEGPGLLVSKAFWIAGICSVGGWIALNYLLAWLGWLG